MNKRILSALLSFVFVFSMATPAMAATKPSTKTIEYQATDDKNLYLPATVKVTNVTSSSTKDFSMYLSDDDVTIKGKNSTVIYCKGSTTITLLPYKGENTDSVIPGAYAFSLFYDSNKVPVKSVINKFKYYTIDENTYMPITTKKYTSTPDSQCVYADGSSYKLTKAGTYVLYVKPYGFYETEDVEYTPIFIVVK